MTTVSEITKKTADLLQGIEDPLVNAKLIVCHVLLIDKLELLTNPNRTVSEKDVLKILELANERNKGKPFSRIKGTKEFFGLEFKINEATLDPRQDTEVLTETVLKETANKTDYKRILDLGTGSGCILLSLLHEMPFATGLGIDKSEKAIMQAKENAKLLGLDKRSDFKTGNWFDGIDEKFDIIVSNPPYIKSDDIKTLQKEVKDHDPIMALDGGMDGLSAYKEIIPKIKSCLTEHGIAALEIGFDQSESIQELLHQNNISNFRMVKDLNGVDRVVLYSIEC